MSLKLSAESRCHFLAKANFDFVILALAGCNIAVFSSPGQSPGRAIVHILALASAAAAVLAKC